KLFKAEGLLEKVTPPVEDSDCGHVYNQYVIRAKKRDALKDYLAKNGVGSDIYYPVPLHLQACFKDWGYKRGSFPVSEGAARETLALPIYPELTVKEIEYVVATIKKFYS
ncbi:MAG: DegT/DnrJ/EryC1/StrS family aminotransferase, partial [Deltaproteobacteria bacterium]|nr:DegT/DnrJ/EryC1/StrS family aminotransferase [Deltaproteobacteria bacterium]